MPNLSVGEIWDHIQQIDPQAYFSLHQELDDEMRAKRPELLAWLRNRHPELFFTLEEVVTAFQNAFWVACNTRSSLLAHYARFRALRDTYIKENRDMIAEMEERLEEKPETNRKRKQVTFSPEDDAIVLEHLSSTVKQLRPDCNLNREWFYAQERFDIQFPLEQYRHLNKKGHRRYTFEEIKDWTSWTTVYHTNGPWHAESLKEELEKEGKHAIIVKKIRGADTEVMGYKVLESDKKPPFLE